MATYAQFKHVELYKIGHGKNRVPNAPKSCIAEIFSSNSTASTPGRYGSPRSHIVHDTPTRPRDTHSRLFGQTVSHPIAPMVTDTIRSHIQFGDSELKKGSQSQSPSKPLANGFGSASLTPSREGNPISGDGYKSMNGQINTVTSANGHSYITHSRVPPGGYSSSLW